MVVRLTAIYTIYRDCSNQADNQKIYFDIFVLNSWCQHYGGDRPTRAMHSNSCRLGSGMSFCIFHRLLNNGILFSLF